MTSPEVVRGRWRNQLGSELDLRVDLAGELSGEYRTVTGAVAGQTFRVRGSCDPRPNDLPLAIGFVVDWRQVHGATAWVGHYFPEEDVIRVTWLMATETDSENDWRSTVIGHDVFRRVPAID
jgi:hypothetical protein